MVIVDLSPNCRWISLRDARALIRVALHGNRPLDQPCTLQLLLDCRSEALHVLDKATAFLDALCHPAKPIPLASFDRITTRHIVVLRVADALALGVGQRAIAVMLFGSARVAEEWRGRSDSLRLAVRRLIVAARAMQVGDWRRLSRTRRNPKR